MFVRRLRVAEIEEVGNLRDERTDDSMDGIRISGNLSRKLWDCEFILAPDVIAIRTASG